MANFNRVESEISDFPVLCEPCLGESQFVRMMKIPNEKQCLVCNRAYTAFRWKPGPKARYKNTVICQGCSKAKHVCQSCILDLKTGLSVRFRDGLNEKKGEEGGLAKDIVVGGDGDDHSKSSRHKGGSAAFRHASRESDPYARNKASVCAYWLKGKCTRGIECPFRHEQDSAEDRPQTYRKVVENIRARYHGNVETAPSTYRGKSKKHKKSQQDEKKSG